MWNVGVYIRLSQEDGDKEESNSVINQREIITSFVKENSDLKLFDYYIDDGYSGTNFDRPGFKKLIDDVENNKINCIVVKDLSRFGRNYIEVGNYLEQIFPVSNIRFISINDYIDSYKDPESLNSIIVPFKNLMNDEYSRDISQKVKYALNTRKRNGEFMGSVVPYGYLRSEEDKHKLVVDENLREVIKKIFSLALTGIGTTIIARKLNDENILSPGEYKIQVLKLKGNFRKKNKQSFWTDSSVASILRNRIYLGEMVQCKYKKISYKIDKRIKNDKDNWIIVKGTHEALVSYKDFNKIQNLLDKRGFKCNNNGTLSIFAGMIKCGDCKNSMVRNKSGNKKKDGSDIVSYYCSTYIRKSHELCTRHLIKAEIVEDIVLKAVKKQIKLVLNQEKLINEIYKERNQNHIKEEYQEKIISINENIQKLENIKKESYLDWKKDIITQEDYFMFVEDYSKKINDYNKEIAELENKINNIKDESIEDYFRHYRKYKNINKLDRTITTELIETIYIYEDKKIEIDFKYNDIYSKINDYIREEDQN